MRGGVSRRSHIIGRFRRQIIRLRHRRGHGVHSPYIYNIVREVFMRRDENTSTSELYNLLLTLNVKNSHALELENLRHHCGFSTFGVDTFEPLDLVLCSTLLPHDDVEKVLKWAMLSGTTVVVLSPHLNPTRGRMCDAIVARHLGTTVNRAGYLIIFNNHLPKQHFTL